MNSRLDEVQAAILRVKLPHLDSQNARRADIARAYTAALADGSLRPPGQREGVSHVYHLYVTRSPDRDRFQAILKQTTASAPASTIRFPSTCSPPMPAASPSARPVARKPKSLPGKSSACRSIRN